MAKIMLHDEEARAALGRGVARLARAVRGTLGPRGMNVFIDRPIGSPAVSRDGAAIAAEIELEDPFENIGAQVVREVSRQTNEVAGDGTTTATVLADALVQAGLAALAGGARPIELAAGLDSAVAAVVAALKQRAVPVADTGQLAAVAVIAANDVTTGRLVAEALARVGPAGVITIEEGGTVETVLEVVDGMAFDRGYLSHHMVTDVERMQVVLDHPLILLTDHKLTAPEEVAGLLAIARDQGRPLLVIAEEVSPACVMALLAERDRGGPAAAAVHPPDYGHWRKAMLEDMAIATGGRVVARDLGGRIETVALRDFGRARQVRISAGQTVITGGGGDPAAIEARRLQVLRQFEAAPPNVERDKFQHRLAKLSGGTARILAGGATPVAVKRRAQLIEDAVAAARGALEEGLLPGGGTALLQVAPVLDGLAEERRGGARQGVLLVQQALVQPLLQVAANAGLDGEAVLARARRAAPGIGLDARTGDLVDLAAAGIVDPVKVTVTALRNAASVAGLILTAQTLIAKKPDYIDPTAGPALGGGAERLGRA